MSSMTVAELGALLTKSRLDLCTVDCNGGVGCMEGTALTETRGNKRILEVLKVLQGRTVILGKTVKDLGAVELVEGDLFVLWYQS